MIDEKLQNNSIAQETISLKHLPQLIAVLKRLPISPSANAYYNPVGGQFKKSVAARKFASEIELYKLKHFRSCEEINVVLDLAIKQGMCWGVDLMFCFAKHLLYTKKNEIKQRDLDNKIKGTIDGLVKIIGIDDKYISQIKVEKFQCKLLEDETCHAKIWITPPPRMEPEIL